MRLRDLFVVPVPDLVPARREPDHEPSQRAQRLRGTAELAARQWGVVDHADLRELGWSTSAVSRAAAAGLLHRLYLGVYAWGHVKLGREGCWLAATRAYGRLAALSHRSCAALQALRPTGRRRIDVTARGGRRGVHRDIDLHIAALAPQDVVVVEGIRCTSVARTLVDLGDVLDRRAVERAMEEAVAQGSFDLAAVHEVARRRTGCRGAAVALELLASWTGGTWTRSALEEMLLAIVDGRGLPRPCFNRHEQGAEVDAVWPEHGLCVEVDSFRFHARRGRFRSDRRKEAALDLAGRRLLRVLDEDLVERPGEVGERLERALRAVGSTRP